MDITKILAIGIIGTFLSVTVRAYKAEFGILTALITSVIILYFLIPQIAQIVTEINEFTVSFGIDVGYIKAITKIIGIAYITEFALELSKDAGEHMLSKKLELAGKITVISIMLPIIKILLTTIVATLADF